MRSVNGALAGFRFDQDSDPVCEKIVHLAPSTTRGIFLGGAQYYGVYNSGMIESVRVGATMTKDKW